MATNSGSGKTSGFTKNNIKEIKIVAKNELKEEDIEDTDVDNYTLIDLFDKSEAKIRRAKRKVAKKCEEFMITLGETLAWRK